MNRNETKLRLLACAAAEKAGYSLGPMHDLFVEAWVAGHASRNAEVRKLKDRISDMGWAAEAQGLPEPPLGIC